MDRRERELIRAQLGVDDGGELAALRAELASARRDAGELRELLAGAVEELAGQRGELDALRADLAQSQGRERAQLATIAQLESELASCAADDAEDGA